MTPRQAAFVREYLVDRNATQAAIRAGYNAANADVTGPRLLGNVGVRLAIAAAEEEVAHRNDLSVDWVIQGLRENYERAMTAHPVLDASGNPTGEYRYDGAVANKALELLGRHLGMWPRTPDINLNDNRTQILTLGGTLPMAALRALAAMKLPEEK